MDGGTDAWVVRELAGCSFADERLNKRLHKLVAQIGSAMGQSIPLVCQDWANTKAAYRFFSNDRVSEADILAGHFQSTRDRTVATGGPILTDGVREAAMLRWGLVPFWFKEPDAGYSTINARAETVATKPTFREPFNRRRCIVPASGFYEWRAEPGSKGKQPYHFRRADGEPMSFAGLWDRWQKGEAEAVESFTIIVGVAPPTIAPYHDRAPVILEPEWFDAWLDPATDPKMLEPMLASFEGAVVIEPVSKAVNNPRNDYAELITPVQSRQGDYPNVAEP